MTAEESRALAFNLSLKKRQKNCIAREVRLQGNKTAAVTLEERTQAVKREENAKQRNKIKYSENEIVCRKTSVNG